MTEETAEVPAQTTSQVAAPQGVRARSAFMPRQFLPPGQGGGIDWINMNVVAKGKGTQAVLGRVFGVCTGWAEKENTLPNGDKSVSIILNGTFQAENYMTGEVSDASKLFLPTAYSQRVKTMFQSDPDLKLVEVDADIGVEATGKTIPYEWVVVAYREGEDMGVMRRLKNSRGRPANAPPALVAPTQGAPAALTDQSQAANPVTGEPTGDVIEGEAKVVEPAKTAKSK